MGLFEDHVLQEGDGIDVLLLDRAVVFLLLTDNYTSSFGLEQYTAGGDGSCTAVVQLGDTDRAEAYLEDADTVKAYLLTHFEEMLEGFAQFLEYGLDITLLHGSLTLDELSQFLSAYEVAVVNSGSIVLSVSQTVTVLVLRFNVLL